MPDFDVVVIGAGQAGLATSYHLKRHDVPHVVLERGKPGHTWSTQRWDTFMLNTMNRFTSMPGMDLNSSNPDAFESAEALVGHFRDFVAANSLPVRENSDVQAVTWSASDGCFEVDVTDSSEPLTSRAVVVASGSQNFPKVPILSNHLPDGITSMHAADYRNPAALPTGAVLVVGSAQTGVQVTEDLLAAGRDVYLSTSKVGRVPRRYRGQDITHWFEETGFYAHSPADLENPAEMTMVQPQVSGTDGGHTVSLQGLASRGVRLLGRLEMVEDGIAQFRDNLGENIEFGDSVSVTIKTRMDAGMRTAGIEPPAEEPDPEDAVDKAAYGMDSPAEVDLADAGITSVIWATGFTGDFSYLDVDGALKDDGQPAHTDGVSEARGIYFIGMPWVRTRASGIVHGVNDDAVAIVEHLRASL